MISEKDFWREDPAAIITEPEFGSANRRRINMNRINIGKINNRIRVNIESFEINFDPNKPDAEKEAYTKALKSLVDLKEEIDDVARKILEKNVL